MSGSQEYHGETFDPDAFDQAAKRLEDKMRGWMPYSDSSDTRARIRTETSSLIMSYVKGIQLKNDPPYVEIPVPEQYEVEVLKSLTRYFVIDAPGLSISQRGQTNVVISLHEELSKLLTSRPHSAPQALLELARATSIEPNDKIRSRAVTDYIASLTEAQAIDLHGRLTAADNARSIFGTWF